MISRKYRIGEFCFQLHTPDDMMIPANMDLFRMEETEQDETEAEVCYRFYYSEDLDKLIAGLEEQKDAGREVKRSDFRLFYINGRECRLLGLKGRPEFYGISMIQEDGNVEVYIRSSYGEWTAQDTIFVSFLMLEKFMMDREAYILHSAYIELEGKAILFSAPSETGKSTQASLWEKYYGARVINGDRSLIYRKEGQWHAAGWPVCGDSHICHNECYPIRTIVMLKQSKVNQVYPMRPMQAFREILTQITINGWNRAFQENAMNGLEQLIIDIPVYRQECDISRQAAEALKAALEENK